MLQQSPRTCGGISICTCTGSSIGIGTGSSTGIGTSRSIGIGTCSSTGTSGGTSVGAQDVDYCLIEDGLVRFRDRIYVPYGSELKKVILREFHAKSYSGHPGYLKTLIGVKRFYYWLNMKRHVAELVARFFDCQCVKVECKHRGGLLQHIVILKWKWEVISMDFITRLQRIMRQHDSIMVIVDRLIKVEHFIPVKSTFSASNVA